MNQATLREALLQQPLSEISRLNFFVQWKRKARAEQWAANDSWWSTWLILAGRGWGKTRTGSEWICQKALLVKKAACAVIAPTFDLLVKVNFEGPSGVLTLLGGIGSPMVANYVKSPSPVVTLYNGSTISGYSAQEPDRLRGPEYQYALLDELAAWQYIQAAYDMVRFCLRIGDNPQMCITTTPKPLPFLRRLLSESGVKVTSGSTYDNRANLAKKFFDEVVKYEGTQIGKQEVYGQLLDFEESGIFKRSWFNIWPNRNQDGTEKKFPKLLFILQSYDTAFKVKQSNDPSAGITLGVFRPYEDKAELAVMLLDCWSERLAYPDLRVKLRKEYDSVFTDDEKPIDIVLIEDKASGQALIPDLQRAGVPVEAYTLPPDADKIQRAHAVSHLAKRYIWLPETKIKGKEWQGKDDKNLTAPYHPRAWVQPFLDQVTMFGPDSYREMERMRRAAIVNDANDDLTTHDDYVDTLTQALAWLRDSEWLRLPADPSNSNEEPAETPKKAAAYG